MMSPVASRTLVGMDPPDDAMESTTSVVWIDAGIVYSRMKGTPRTVDSVLETFAVIRDLIDGVPMPVLFDLRKRLASERDKWDTFIEHALSLFTAVAFVVDPESSPRIGGYPEAINRLLIPFGVFTDEAEALAFLRDGAGLPQSE